MGNYQAGNNMPPKLDGNDLLNMVKPKMKEELDAAKTLMTVVAALIPVFFILFGVGGFTSVNTMGSPGSVAMIAIGFIGFGACGILSGFFSVRHHKLKALVTMMNEILGRDKSRIEDLSLNLEVGKGSVLMIIKKLIETNNLEGYEVIGDVGVAKTSLHCSVKDFITTADSVRVVVEEQKPRKNNCPNCGAGITSKSGNFCEFCGTKL